MNNDYWTQADPEISRLYELLVRKMDPTFPPMGQEWIAVEQKDTPESIRTKNSVFQSTLESRYFRKSISNYREDMSYGYYAYEHRMWEAVGIPDSIEIKLVVVESIDDNSSHKSIFSLYGIHEKLVPLLIRWGADEIFFQEKESNSEKDISLIQLFASLMYPNHSINQDKCILIREDKKEENSNLWVRSYQWGDDSCDLEKTIKKEPWGRRTVETTSYELTGVAEEESLSLQVYQPYEKERQVTIHYKTTIDAVFKFIQRILQS